MKFNCFPCCGRTKHAPTIRFDLSEPSEYVVEKLTVRRVPIRLFTTTPECEGIPVMAISRAVPAYSAVYADNRMPYAAYYGMVPETNIKAASSTTTPLRSESAMTLGDEEDEPKPPKKKEYKSKPTLTEEQEKMIVTKILNAYSSLHTLQSKEKIPKDPAPVNRPSRPPDAPVFIPKHLMPKVESYMMKTTAQLSSMLLPPDIQSTINALGQANKSNNRPGIRPKNQRKFVPVVRSKTEEKEYSSRPLAGLTSQSILQLYKPDAKRMPAVASCSMPVESGVSPVFRDATVEPSPSLSRTMKIIDPSIYKDSETQPSRHSLVYRKRSASNIPLESSSLRLSRSNVFAAVASTISELMDDGFLKAKTVDSYTTRSGTEVVPGISADPQEITEISQMNGQSLKWRIIIKHQPKEEEGQKPDHTLEVLLDSDIYSKRK